LLEYTPVAAASWRENRRTGRSYGESGGDDPGALTACVSFDTMTALFTAAGPSCPPVRRLAQQARRGRLVGARDIFWVGAEFIERLR
jgi:hypothetical protein